MSEVPYQTRTTGTSTQLKAAQRTTSLAVSGTGGAEVCARGTGRDAVSGPGTVCSLVRI